MERYISKQYGVIDARGKLRIYNREIFYDHIERNPRTNVEVIVIERESVIDNKLRGYYFGVVVKELQKAIFEAGDEWSLEQVDTFFRGLGLYKESYNEITGKYDREILSLSGAVTTVTRKQMKHYIGFCIRIAADYLNHPIPFPGEELEKETP